MCEVAAAPPVAELTVTVADPSPATTPGTAGTFGINAPEVITRLPPPLQETATNRPLPYVTEAQKLLAGVVLDVHVMPSGLVITRLPLPV